MAFSAGKDAVFKLDDSGGTLVDISAYVETVDTPMTADSHETSTMGKAHKTRIPGLKDTTISIDGPQDPVIDAQLYSILGTGSINWEYHPSGEGSGLPFYDPTTDDAPEGGTLVCTGYNPSGGVSSKNAYSATFQVSGDPTRTVT